MKAMAKGVGISAFVLAVLLAYSTVRGYSEWWLMSAGHVAVDGIRVGYLHTNWSHSAVMITRTDSEKYQSYLVWLSRSKSVIYCGDWHAPRFPAFALGDVNPPCMGIFDNPAPPGRGSRPGFNLDG